MKQTFLHIIIFALAFFLLACAAQSFVCPDGTVVDDESQCPAPSAPEQEIVPDEESEPEPEPELDLPLSKTVAEMQEKAAKVQSYSFTFAELPENKATRRYFVYGDYARVELYMGSTRAANSFDTVYLDLENDRAVAYCMTGSTVICPDKTAVIERPPFSDYYFELPHEFMASVTNAEDAGSLTSGSLSAKIFTTIKDGKHMRVRAMSYYGIPLRIEVYGSDDYVGEAGGYDFRDMAVNTVKDADVTPPSGW